MPDLETLSRELRSDYARDIGFVGDCDFRKLSADDETRIAAEADVRYRAADALAALLAETKSLREALKEEREACAKVVEEYANLFGIRLSALATLIRARSTLSPAKEEKT
jgi:hypothetical protein